MPTFKFYSASGKLRVMKKGGQSKQGYCILKQVKTPRSENLDSDIVKQIRDMKTSM